MWWRRRRHRSHPIQRGPPEPTHRDLCGARRGAAACPEAVPADRRSGGGGAAHQKGGGGGDGGEGGCGGGGAIIAATRFSAAAIVGLHRLDNKVELLLFCNQSKKNTTTFTAFLVHGPEEG